MQKHLIVVFLVLSAAPVNSRQSSRPDSGCAMGKEALAAYKKLKPQITRRDVEKDFDSLGLSFRNEGTFGYKKCWYIQVKITFKFDPSVERALSPNDTIVSVSQLFIDYPAMD